MAVRGTRQTLSEQPFDAESVQRRRLANGLTAIVRVDHSAPVVAIVTCLKVGYFDEPDELAGISHVLEHMFFKGTPTRGPGQIAQQTKAAGGYLNAATIYDHTSYYTVLPARSLAEGLAIQSDALLNSVLDADELHRELQVIIQEAKRKLDQPGAVAAETLYELMHDRHRMRRWRIGTESFLQSLTRAQLDAFYHQYYRGERAIVVVAGDVDGEQTLDSIETYYVSLPAHAPAFERGPVEPRHNGFRLREQAGDIVEAHLELGWHTETPLHPDSAALDLLSIVLGQGRASRLYRGVREAGLVHSIGARNYTPTELGVFQISAELDAADAQSALRAIASIVEGAAGSIGQDEVARARSVIEARALRKLESMEGQANYLAEWEALGDWQLGGEYLAQIRALQPAHVEAVATRYLAVERAAVFLYHPRESAPLGVSAEALALSMKAGAAAALPALACVPAARRNPQAAQAERSEDGVHFFQTDSGVPVIVKPRRHTPLVSLALAVLGGPSLEVAARAGHSALAARTSIKGTRSRSAAQLALDAEALGGSIHPGVGADLLDWSTTVPSQHFDAALELLLDAALHPTFPDEDTEKEKKVALADLQQVRDDMYRYPLRLFLAAAFPDHSYGFTLEQTEQAITRASAADLRSWHRHSVRDARPVVFIVGDVDAQRAADSVAQLLEPSGNQLEQPRASSWPDAPIEVKAARPKAQTALVLGYPGVDHKHPDALALQLLANTIAGLGGRLFEELRSRRSLAYTVTAFPIARALGGAFIGYIATAPEREDEARQSLLQEFARLREELLPEDDVERARRYTIGGWQIRSQSNAVQLHELVEALLIGRGLSEIREFEQNVLAVTPELLRTVAQRYLVDERRVEAVVRGSGGSR